MNDQPPTDQTDHQQACAVALNAIVKFTALHPEANPHDWRIIFLSFDGPDGEEMTADVVPTDRYYRESLN